MARTWGTGAAPAAAAELHRAVSPQAVRPLQPRSLVGGLRAASVTIRVEHGDCRDVLATLDADSLAACVTDPPYELGFMGRAWDASGVAFEADTWRAVLRVLRPGAHMLAFGGTRTAHRMVCAIEDAGFEIRDTLCWLYGSGFPKSRNLDGEWQGWGTALKPAHEPIILARKPFNGTVAANVLAHGVGALNIDGCRIATSPADQAYIAEHIGGFNQTRSIGGKSAYGGGEVIDRAATYDAAKGRWPANVAHDGSAEVLEAFAAFGQCDSRPVKPENLGISGSGQPRGMFQIGSTVQNGYYDNGTAARFFYCAKADTADRADSRHPTVKPVDLLRWLVRLITPPGGTVLDPFAVTGTTAEAAMLEGFDAILIEADAQHVADIRHRIARWSGLDAPLFAGLT
jgi:site-specific DNA-methyltransferase (adenine-specific)